MIKLNIPIDKKEIRKLKTGDVVLLNGIIFTGRDMAHKYLIENDDEELKKKLKDGVIYHCGPIVNTDNGYEIIAAGPTTSIREEPYQADIIKKYGLRAVIGKGGMGKKTLNACKKHGCVYLHAIGGAAQVLAKTILRVNNVYKSEFGMPEAIWEFEVENFPAVVTMDAKGKSLHEDVLKKSEKAFKKLISQS